MYEREEAQFSLFQYPCFCMGKLIIDKITIGASQIWYNYSAIQLLEYCDGNIGLFYIAPCQVIALNLLNILD